MKNKVFTFLGIILVVVLGYLILAAPMTFYKTGIVKELFAFQYNNPEYLNNREWTDKVTQWRRDNSLTAPDVNDFFFPYTSIHAFTVNKYDIIPNDEMGVEFRDFVERSLPSVTQEIDSQKEAREKKMMDNIEKNTGG